MNINKNIIAVIPAYNEENSIGNIILSTKKYVNDIIVYDDGSSDKTSEIAIKYGAKLITNKKRKGKGTALKILFKEAIKYKPDIIISIDADGQHDPSDIPELIKPIIYDDLDIIIGSRFLKGSFTDIPSLRNFGLKFINFLHGFLFRLQIKDTQSGFRAFSNKAFKIVLESNENGYGIESEQLIMAKNEGLKISEVPVFIKYNDLYKTSKSNFIRHGLEIVLILLKFFFQAKTRTNLSKKHK